MIGWILIGAGMILIFMSIFLYIYNRRHPLVYQQTKKIVIRGIIASEEKDNSDKVHTELEHHTLRRHNTVKMPDARKK